ncbi:MAG: YlxR family protein [Acidimicrobiales bacterium]
MGCKRRLPQRELARIVMSEEGSIGIGASSCGRGAWLCVGSVDCVELAIRAKAFRRAFRRDVPVETVERMRKSISDYNRRASGR